MFYSKRFGGFLPICSLVTTSIAGFRLKDWLAGKSVGVLLAVVLGIFAASFIILYILNILALIVFRRREFEGRLSEAWKGRLISVLEERQYQRSMNDYMDHAVQIQIAVSRPSMLGSVAASLFEDEKKKREQLRKEAETVQKGPELPASIHSLANRWRSFDVPSRRSPRLVDDPVHGCISLDEVLATVLAHPLLQRLNRVRQLSFSYTQFPSSTHSRLSHSLGVAKNTEAALSGIFDRGLYYVQGERHERELPKEILRQRDEIVRRGKLVALLHDVGHGPFGHALDTYVSFRSSGAYRAKPDKTYTARYVKEFLSPTLSKFGFDANEIVKILDPHQRLAVTGFDALIAEIVDSPLDADRMDYLMRDAHMTGLAMGNTNTPALLQYIRPMCEGPYQENLAFMLSFDEAASVYMEHFTYAREAMYHTCYEHPRKRAAEQVFQRLVEQLVTSHAIELDDLYALTDEEILSVIRTSGHISSDCKAAVELLLTDMDFDVVHEVQIISPNVSLQLATWIESGLRIRGEDPKLLYLVRPGLWEEAIANGSIGAARRHEIQVLVPPPKQYLQQQSSTRILRQEEGVYSCVNFLDWRPELKVMFDTMDKNRNRVRVVCPSNLNPADRESVRAAARQELGY